MMNQKLSLYTIRINFYVLKEMMKKENFLMILLIIISLINVFVCISFYSTGQETYDTMKDIEGNYYKTIVLGNQVWMSENLKTTKLNNGIKISNVTDLFEWVRTTEPAFSWYDNEISNKLKYGGLYNWHAVNTGKLCPEGWRVPSDNDWTILFEFMGEENLAYNKLKMSGLSLTFGGYRYGYFWGSGLFYEKDVNGYLWSSTRATKTHIWSRTISNQNSKVYRSYFTDNNGFSIRCIKND